jgi:hypothetical protein
MAETTPLQTKLDADTASLASHTAQLADIKLRLLKLEGVQPVSVPTPVPLPSPQLIWHAGLEVGNLAEWAVPNNNTGSALSSAVQAAAEGIPARTPWVMKQAVSANGAATRMGATSIVSQVKSGTPWWVTWYDFYPAPIRFGSSDQFMFLQIAGFDGVNYNPVWGFYKSGTDDTPIIIWSPNDKAPAEGPHAGEAGKRVYTTSTPIPVGKWTKFELYVDASQNFMGALQLYMDGAKLFDQSLIKTRYPGAGDPGVAGYMYLEHCAYGSPGVHMVDDVTYSLGRMP